jgi:hypothetical protein
MLWRGWQSQVCLGLRCNIAEAKEKLEQAITSAPVVRRVKPATIAILKINCRHSLYAKTIPSIGRITSHAIIFWNRYKNPLIHQAMVSYLD